MFIILQTMRFVRSLPVGPIIANALVLAAPLEALAETCEAEQSVFNMNMPLLLLVALIGATVGGEIYLLCTHDTILTLFTYIMDFDRFGLYLTSNFKTFNFLNGSEVMSTLSENQQKLELLLRVEQVISCYFRASFFIEIGKWCKVGFQIAGLLARQRKAELQRLNEQLRQINAALKRQAKIESYAPTLSYAPAAARVPDNEVIVDPKKQELISRLKNGKNFLRNQNPDKAFSEFKAALELAQNIKDPIEEKKAARGLGASMQRQGKYKEAIKYHSMVLSISEREEEDSGNTEAFGAIADCYTELGDLEKAASFYDQYIARLQAD
ncbi:putative tetratricopeptide-like helical domain superfamily, protein FLUORESCENT IN BLUE LIGHT [Helianthus annuus]|nr:putative tetratricopeptide-like helical domain superfamily, protein FLUORESCENT IN BLUE LIGHT [Helianthus annuus]KAJ0650807.1 putative tetratricopeptide-like helical domain superfamily, protein FLUORESCENT IN BLUE LIGHT [Helianthus annuus]